MSDDQVRTWHCPGSLSVDAMCTSPPTPRSEATAAHCSHCGHLLEDADVFWWCPECQGPRKPQDDVLALLHEATP